MLGKAAVAMWWDVAPEMKSDWEDWHSHEHMPERLGIRGFLRGTRWIALSGEPSYFVLYEAEELATIVGGPYLERLNNPTPWSRKMMPHHRNMVRSLCTLRAGWGGGVPQTLATLRFTPRAGALPELPRRKGLTGAHLLESRPMTGPQTIEQKIRGGDSSADWVLLIGGYDDDAVAKAAHELSAGPFAAHGAAFGLYRPAYSLTARDLQ
jgi:hypothetical protein